MSVDAASPDKRDRRGPERRLDQQAFDGPNRRTADRRSGRDRRSEPRAER